MICEQEVTLGVVCPTVCPPSLRGLVAGRIERGIFYPSGSVARHFFEQERTKTAEAPKPRYVYFIQGERGGPIKIGKAVDVRTRLDALQIGSPLKLRVIGTLCSEDAGKLERELHKRFAGQRLHGEWFDESTALLEVIQSAE